MPQPPFDVKLSSLNPDGSPGGEATLSSEELLDLRIYLVDHWDEMSDGDKNRLSHLCFVLDCFV